MNKELMYMARTFNPKTVIYHSTGDGRDAFIQSNNGGFYKSGFRKMNGGNYMTEHNPKFTFHAVKTYLLSYLQNIIRREPVILKYRGDGTGRDGYIKDQNRIILIFFLARKKK